MIDSCGTVHLNNLGKEPLDNVLTQISTKYETSGPCGFRQDDV